MSKFFADFLDEDAGAITVDWVVLTAAIVGMAILIVATVRVAAIDTSTGVGAAIKSQTVRMN